jgi:uncharacterized protein with GYD domain
MAMFVVLTSLTDQGIRSVKDTVTRARAVKDQAQKMGITIKDICWTMGRYDLVVTVDAPDDEAMMAFGLAVGSKGNVRTETLRAFSGQDVEKMLAKLG